MSGLYVLRDSVPEFLGETRAWLLDHPYAEGLALLQKGGGRDLELFSLPTTSQDVFDLAKDKPAALRRFGSPVHPAAVYAMSRRIPAVWRGQLLPLIDNAATDGGWVRDDPPGPHFTLYFPNYGTLDFRDSLSTHYTSWRSKGEPHSQTRDPYDILHELLRAR